MKKIALAALIAFFPTFLFAQFDSILIEEVDNKGLVEGRTFRIYVVVKNEGDQVHAIFADSNNDLFIKSTEPFYQNDYGGALASNVNKRLKREKPELNYDSWFTIGYSDNYRNQVKEWALDFSSFESGGDFILKDGAWFVTPDDSQAYAKADKKILIAQLTTTGTITGSINIQGRTGENETDQYGNLQWQTWKVVDIEFTCGGEQ
ncbi:hypothetical protein [Halocola ammonii]